MNYEEELAWAQGEHAARLADLKDRTPEGLRRAQENAESRRKAVGLSRSEAAAAVMAAGRARRIEAMRPAALPSAPPAPAQDRDDGGKNVFLPDNIRYTSWCDTHSRGTPCDKCAESRPTTGDEK